LPGHKFCESNQSLAESEQISQFLIVFKNYDDFLFLKERCRMRGAMI